MAGAPVAAKSKAKPKRVAFSRLEEGAVANVPEGKTLADTTLALQEDNDEIIGDEIPDGETLSRWHHCLKCIVKHSFTATLIVLWYAASIVCNQTSKDLLRSRSEGGGGMSSAMLTLAQCVVSVGCGLAVMLASSAWSRSLPYSYLITSRAQLADTSMLAVAFAMGFWTLNLSFAAMHVSLVMVLRAGEPLTTLVLSRLLLPPSAWPTRAKAVAILPVVLGGALSAVGPHGPTTIGLALCMASNACFSLRSIFAKRITQRYGTTALPLFWQLCVLSSLMQAVVVAAMALVSGTRDDASPSQPHSLLPHPPTDLVPYLDPDDLTSTILLNGSSFYAYLQLSFAVLGLMSAVSHSVANSMRRPATILAAIAYAPIELSALNILGIAVACGASLVYGLL